MHNKTKINPFILVLALLLIGSCTNMNEMVEIEINGENYKFELANTQPTREKGLMFREKLDDDSGMLFVYSYENYRYFYMRNTFIPLDIAFLDKNLTVVSIKSMMPLDETTVASEKKAMYALEVNRGFFEKTGVKVGDEIKLLTPIRYFE